MRLTNAWLLVLAAATSSSSIVVSGFQLSRSYLSSPRVASSSIKVAATSDAVAEAASPPTSTTPNNNNGEHSMTYADINALAFRALQRQCKSLGLSAVGTTAALRGRLLEHYSLNKEVTTKAVETPTATASEIEVSCFVSKYIVCCRRKY